MIVILNNGTRIKISHETAQGILKRLLSGEAKQWQIMLDSQNKNSPINGYNLSQISAICSDEDIVDDLSFNSKL